MHTKNKPAMDSALPIVPVQRDVQFYKRAFEEPAFRDSALKDLSRRITTNKIIVWCFIIAAVVAEIHGWRRSHSFQEGLFPVFLGGLFAAELGVCRTKKAALEFLKTQSPRGN